MHRSTSVGDPAKKRLGLEQYYATPLLRGKTSTGKVKYWQGFCLATSNSVGGSYDYYTQSRYFQGPGDTTNAQQGSDWEALEAEGLISKIQYSAPVLVEYKNQGKSNEVHPGQQAVKEINAESRLKMDKGYSIVGEKAVEKLPLPMLAHKYAEKSHLVKFACVFQPKYDGSRLLSDGKIAWTRGGKQVNPEVISHILKDLDTGGAVVDGELIMPEGTPLQDTMKAIKKYRPESSPRLLYRLYDVVDEALEYDARYHILTEIASKSGKSVILAPYGVANSEEELMEAHEENVRQGWEGTMVRLLGYGYKIGQRSSSLLKIKDFQDAEFLVTSVGEGKGKFEGAAIFTCITESGGEFQVCPLGDMEQRRYYYSHPEEVVGTMWTIRYQNLSKDGIPIFPRAICEREVEG
jgi:hypothetical protein